jgi:hypothetical protein
MLTNPVFKNEGFENLFQFTKLEFTASYGISEHVRPSTIHRWIFHPALSLIG